MGRCTIWTSKSSHSRARRSTAAFRSESQREADVVVKARPPHPPTPSAIRRRDSHSTSAGRLILEGKPRSTVRWQTINEPQHWLSASAPLHHYDQDEPANKLVRLPGRLASSPSAILWLETHPRAHAPRASHNVASSIPPTRRRPDRQASTVVLAFVALSACSSKRISRGQCCGSLMVAPDRGLWLSPPG